MIRANSWRAAANATTERRVNERPEQRNLNSNAAAADPRRYRNTITVTQRVNHRGHLGRHHLVSTRRKWARHNRLALFGITTPIHNELDQSPINRPSRINQLSRETLHRHRNAARSGLRTAHDPQCRTLPNPGHRHGACVAESCSVFLCARRALRQHENGTVARQSASPDTNPLDVFLNFTRRIAGISCQWPVGSAQRR